MYINPHLIILIIESAVFNEFYNKYSYTEYDLVQQSQQIRIQRPILNLINFTKEFL